MLLASCSTMHFGVKNDFKLFFFIRNSNCVENEPLYFARVCSLPFGKLSDLLTECYGLKLKAFVHDQVCCIQLCQLYTV